MSLRYNGKIIPLAKQLRREATRQEKRLWYDFLSGYPVRFQRQKTIGDYIADFYCHKARLVVELDGSQHYTEEGERSDKARSDVLEGRGLQVLRFSNYEVDRNFEGVCTCIDHVVQNSLSQPR